jgi:UTP--glucose-1-phosphate uridylyltransferase
MTSMSALKAVISTAGFGTRFFPVGKSVNKAMLPILNRPVVDHLVTECVQAGVTEIGLVVMAGDTQLRGYFTEDRTLKDYFFSRGWEEKYRPVAHLHSQAEFTFIEQSLDGRYGTAIPAMLAQEFVGDADFFLLTGDDLVLRADGGSDLADLRDACDEAGAAGGIAVTEVPPEHVSRYGIISTRRHGPAEVLDGAVEKPAPESAPSNLASISRFLLTPAIFKYLEALRPDARSGEYLSISALLDHAQDHPVLVHRITGDYYDCGSIGGWLDANLAAAAQRDDHSA